MRAEIHPLHFTKGGHNKVSKRNSVECCGLKPDCCGLRVECVMRMRGQEAETRSFKRSESLGKKVAVAEGGMESEGFETGNDLCASSPSHPACFKPNSILKL